MYNKTNITQLGMCVVVITFKSIKKRCVFFVVPGNGQVLLGMSDTATLRLININIDSIQVEMAESKTNIEQEMHVGEKAVQTWMQIQKQNKAPMVKMAKTMQTNQLITSSHHLM